MEALRPAANTYFAATAAKVAGIGTESRIAKKAHPKKFDNIGNWDVCHIVSKKLVNPTRIPPSNLLIFFVQSP